MIINRKWGLISSYEYLNENWNYNTIFLKSFSNIMDKYQNKNDYHNIKIGFYKEFNIINQIILKYELKAEQFWLGEEFYINHQ